MQLIFRKINPEDDADIARSNALMDDLSERTRDDAPCARLCAAITPAATPRTGTSALCGSLLAVLADDYCGACRPILLVENVVTKKTNYKKSRLKTKNADRL